MRAFEKGTPHWTVLLEALKQLNGANLVLEIK